MNTNINTEQGKELDRIYSTLNSSLFEPSLPCVLITPRFKVKTSKQFFQNAAQNRKDGSLITQIEIEQEFINRGTVEFCTELTHQMIHFWQYLYGENKPTRHKHNKEWLEFAELIGFAVKAESEYVVKLEPIIGGHFMQAVALIDEMNLLNPTNVTQYAEVEPVKKKTRSGERDKWQCPCGLSYGWASIQPEVTCNHCGQGWSKVSK